MTIQKLIEKYLVERKYYLNNKYKETLLDSDFLDSFLSYLVETKKYLILLLIVNSRKW